MLSLWTVIVCHSALHYRRITIMALNTVTMSIRLLYCKYNLLLEHLTLVLATPRRLSNFAGSLPKFELKFRWLVPGVYNQASQVFQRSSASCAYKVSDVIA